MWTCHSSKYESLAGEFTQISATIVAASSKPALPVSVFRNASSERDSCSLHGVRGGGTVAVAEGEGVTRERGAKQCVARAKPLGAPARVSLLVAWSLGH